MKFSKHFDSSEFGCNCGQCEFDGSQMNPEFMDFLIKLRAVFGEPMVITSGIRCKTFNAAINGRPNSYHTQGRAVDVLCTDGLTRHELVRLVLDMGGSCGVYSNFIHIDNRKNSVLFHGKY